MRIIFRSLIIFFLIFIMAIIYLSTIGVETSKFNKQIGSIISNLDKDLVIELQKVKIILDPFNLEFNAKTIGPKLSIKDKTIELESIKTQIIIDTFFNNDFSLKNLDISTRSLEIENLISFIRSFKNTPELYLFEKIVKKGFLISDINIEFDKEGKVKNNYRIEGLVKDAQLKFLKEYNLSKINFLFNFEKKTLEFKDLEFLINNTKFLSEKIKINENAKNQFLIEGIAQAQNLDLNDRFISNFLRDNLPKFDFIDLDLNIKNKFSFMFNKKLKVDNLNLFSEIKINNLKLQNNLGLSSFMPNLKNEINLNNHLISVDYKKNSLSINGKGDIFFQDKKDFVNYSFLKKKNSLDFETNFIIDKNPLVIDFLAYKKNSDLKAEISFSGFHNFNKNTIIKSFSYNEKKNKIKFNQLLMNKDFKIKSINEIDLEYFDQDLRENKIKILKKKNDKYEIRGTKFNANSLIDSLIKDEENNLKIFDKNFNFEIKIDQVFLDKEYVINDLNGYLNIKDNKIVNGDLGAFFSKNEKLKLTIKTNDTEKVTTLFLDQAEPIVKRYKFIKGYKGGSLDFYSSKKGNKSFSNLKIYDFRVKDLPILTKLLTLASLQGIADILSGEGITFDEFEMNFENQDKLMTISEMYAIGPAISILMDGYIEKNELISLRGSLVPATTINKAIGNIPVLGKILVGSKTGEGVFGVSFKIKGAPEKLETSVNPIKTLTPRFITRTLEKIKKN